MPWDKEFECMPVEKMQKLQLEKLRETIAWVAERVPFYKNKFKEAGLTAADIQSLDDISKFPVTVKNDLRDNYPFGLCAVDLKDVVRVHASSGTTGKPITGPYTQADLDQWTEPGANPDGSRNKFRTALKDFKREGHIGFQDHGAWVAYRNVRIKVLD